MNQNFEQLNQNRYEGNGWSKYQVMVLQQLDDHNKVLQNLNKEIVDIKQNIAVAEAELKIWRAHIMSDVVEVRTDVDHILYDEKGINQRLATMEREMDVEEQASTKTKATWVLYGSIAVFIINVLVQLLPILLKIK